MNYTAKEIARAKTLRAQDLRDGKGTHVAVMVSAGLSRRRQGSLVMHERTWRDYLPQARRELRREVSE